ncbi:hypothetical protein B0H13DRAFT_1871566 [Mycena leptocephala]|nr:hypothetical protein B0H13DRAFT_1871566 [Mycena leptocephala]
MNGAEFTFTCPPPMATVDPLPPAPPLLSVFHANPIKIPGGRAEAQARYRARNREAKCERARRRMQQLREGRKDEEMERLRRQASSERLRSTLHVERHLGAVYGDPADPDFEAAFDRFRFKGGPPFDREDAIFLLTHATAQPTSAPPGSEDIERCLAQLNRCTLVLDFSWEDPDAVDGYQKLRSSPQVDWVGVAGVAFRHRQQKRTRMLGKTNCFGGSAKFIASWWSTSMARRQGKRAQYSAKTSFQNSRRVLSGLLTNRGTRHSRNRRRSPWNRKGGAGIGYFLGSVRMAGKGEGDERGLGNVASGYLGVWGLEDAREHRRGGGGGSPGTSEGKVGMPTVSFGGASTTNDVLSIGKRVKELRRGNAVAGKMVRKKTTFGARLRVFERLDFHDGGSSNHEVLRLKGVAADAHGMYTSLLVQTSGGSSIQDARTSVTGFERFVKVRRGRGEPK